MTVYMIYVDGVPDHQTGAEDIDGWVAAVRATHEALHHRPVEVKARATIRTSLDINHGLFDNARNQVDR